MLAIGDGALGFWKAVREAFPDTVNNAAGGTPELSTANNEAIGSEVA